MLNLAVHTLQSLGATEIENSETLDVSDPTTEEEFKKIKFKSETPITWEMYQKAEEETIPKLHELQRRVAKEICKNACLKALQDSDYLMTMDRFMELENGDEWIAYRKLLRTLPDTMDYDALRFSVTQLDFQKCVPPSPPPIKKKTA